MASNTCHPEVVCLQDHPPLSQATGEVSASFGQPLRVPLDVSTWYQLLTRLTTDRPLVFRSTTTRRTPSPSRTPEPSHHLIQPNPSFSREEASKR